MARPDKISLPSGMGGITRYFEEYHSKVEFTPGHIVIMAVVIIILMIILHVYGNALLGI